MAPAFLEDAAACMGGGGGVIRTIPAPLPCQAPLTDAQHVQDLTLCASAAAAARCSQCGDWPLTLCTEG